MGPFERTDPRASPIHTHTTCRRNLQCVMASTTQTPVKDPPSIPAPSYSLTPSKPVTPSLSPITPLAPPEPDAVHVPSYSRWFSWDDIHECEARFLPEFFDSRSPSKNPRVYRYLRNSIIKQYRQNPLRKITFTEVRKTLVGDVGSIRRVFDFLDAWGLINYSPPAKPFKWDDKAADAGGGNESSNKNETSKRLCNSCKLVCSIACFASEKYDLTLCARCYVRGNHSVGANTSGFKRVVINEETKAEWREKETLLLLEALMHYGDDWKRVAQHVGGGRSEKECVNHFIKLPFGEEFMGSQDPGEINKPNEVKEHNGSECGSLARKRMCLNPLADASNPIMAQAAFLSALAGVDVAEAAAQAAVRSLSEVEKGSTGENPDSLSRSSTQHVGTDTALSAVEGRGHASSVIEKEEMDVEKSISRIAEVQMKEVLDKIVHFEELDEQMEKERRQLEQMQHLLFVDKLNLLFHKNSAPKAGGVAENVKAI